MISRHAAEPSGYEEDTMENPSSGMGLESTGLESVGSGHHLPRWFAALIVGAVIVGVAVKRCRPERALLWTLGAALILTPVFRPQYALWMLPLAALRLSVPWMVFTGLALLPYAGLDVFRNTGVWPEFVWVRLFLWIPMVALLVLEGHRLWKARFPDMTGPGRGPA